MWYMITAFVMWLVEELEEMVGEKAAPWVLYIIVAIIFSLLGWYFAEWVIRPITGWEN